MTPGKKSPTSPIIESMRTVGRNELAAVEFLEARRWGSAPACPRCGSLSVYQMRDTTGERNKDYRWRCRDCKRMCTVRTATAFEGSRLPLWVWIHGFCCACSSMKGVSALQLGRECEISYRTALSLVKQIRRVIPEDSNMFPSYDNHAAAQSAGGGLHSRNE